MSDKLEKFVKAHREQFDQQTPRPELWEQIQSGLGSSPAGGGGEGSVAAGGGKLATGLGRLSTAWKFAIGGVVAALGGVALYLAVQGVQPTEGGKKDGAPNEVVKSNGVEPDVLPPLVRPPLPAADVAYHTFEVDGQKGGYYRLENGSQILVGQEMFVDGQGQAVKGPVQMKYREFHDAADILLSGIPMLYDEKGVKGNFETAGMIEVLAFQNGEPVHLAAGKSIQIDMRSYESEDNYNLYYLDPERRGWTDIGKAKLSRKDNKAPQKVAEKELPEPKRPAKPADIQKNGEISFSADYTAFPELKPFKDIRWVAADPEELKAKEGIFAKVWNDVKLERVENSSRMEYTFVLSKKGKTARINALPLLQGADYETALAEFNKQKARYDKLLAQRVAEGERLQRENEVMRSFAVAKLGIYNCDRLQALVDPVTLTVNFDYGDDVYMSSANTTLFLINGGAKAVLPLADLRQNYPLKYSLRDENHLVAILPDGKVGHFSPEEFAQIDVEAAKSAGVAYDLKIRNTGKTIQNAADLRAVLGI